MLDLIKKTSPRFAGVLSRIPQYTDNSIIEAAYGFAHKNGGCQEIDYQRPEGQSHNPRLARIGLMTITELKNTSSDCLSAALLSTATLNSLEHAPFAENILRLASRARQLENEITTGNNIIREDLFCYNLALLLCLDRARHLHLCKADKKIDLERMFREIMPRYLALAKDIESPVYPLLHAWFERFSNTAAIKI
ncbi:MAG: hypothetical protein IT292_09225 [Deltaproteobacteria bacterium]|nr:hypothetical protein [Deltaproteobacteria bacterium]